MLYIRSVDGRVRRYDLRMGQLNVDFTGSELYHTHEGMRTCFLYCVMSNAPVVCFTGPITCVCFSRDGQCTLSSSLDSTVRLLDKSSGEMLGEYVQHRSNYYINTVKLDLKLAMLVATSQE